MEKTREILGELLPLADVVFVGKDFSVMKGAENCVQAAEMFSKILPKGLIFYLDVQDCWIAELVISSIFLCLEL